MKLLSICVPTYNRYSELKKLFESFIDPVLSKHREDIEFIISDNSDKEVAELDEKLFNNTCVIYSKNVANIGFAGNVLKCYDKAVGKFIWIISDNDQIILDEFLLLFQNLKKNQDNIDAVFIPYRVVDLFQKETIVAYPKIDCLDDLYKKNIIPFILISSAIVKKNMRYYDTILAKLADNDFVQIALHSLALKDCTQFSTYKHPVIEYTIEYVGRFNPIKIFNSMHQTMMYLSHYFTIDVNFSDGNECKSMLHSIFMHEINLLVVKDLENVKSKIVDICKGYKYKDIKMKLLIYLLKLPKSFRFTLYVCYLIFSCEPKFASLSEYYSRYSIIKSKIKRN